MWTVFDKPLTINKETRDLITKTAETRSVNNNYRVTLPYNGRELKFYHNHKSHNDNSPSVTAKPTIVSSAETTTASIFFATCVAIALY